MQEMFFQKMDAYNQIKGLKREPDFEDITLGLMTDKQKLDKDMKRNYKLLNLIKYLTIKVKQKL